MKKTDGDNKPYSLETLGIKEGTEKNDFEAHIKVCFNKFCNF